MDKLLWLDGITWETEIGDIGWTYVLMTILFIVLALLINIFIRDYRS